MNKRLGKSRSEPKREQRIAETVLRTAGTRHETIAAWYRYLNARVTFPFAATYLGKGVNPLCGGAVVQVVGFAKPEFCTETIQVRVMDGMGSIMIPLSLLSLCDAEAGYFEAIADWNYWYARNGKVP